MTKWLVFIAREKKRDGDCKDRHYREFENWDRKAYRWYTPHPSQKSADVFSEEVEYALRPGHFISRILDY